MPERNDNWWADRRVLVTGGAGFLGSRVTHRLRALPCAEVFVPRSRDYDLVQAADVQRMYEAARPDVVIHLAARVGGIGMNEAHPGRLFYENIMMGVQAMEEARRRGVKKFVAIGTICAYPKHTPVPFREETLWDGYPEETNAAYGLAKKALLVQAQAYRQEYGFNAIYLLPVNLYGPGDNTDPQSAHVIPALIRKCVEAKERGERTITGWGSGTPTREFLYVEDAAEAIVLAAARYDGAEPVNVGSGEEISIRELAARIMDYTGFKGEVVWDTSRPDGQPKRRLATDRAERAFGFRARTSLRDGLRETVAWAMRQMIEAKA